MGLSGVSYTNIICYTFNGVMIVRIQFYKDPFQKLIVKLNLFCEDYVVPQVLEKEKRIFFLTKNGNETWFQIKKTSKCNVIYSIYYTKDHIFYLITD